MTGNADADARRYRDQGEPLLPRRDDVRAWGNPDHEDSIRIIHAALDGGINFVDTADVCSAGESEEIVGQALRGRRDDVVLATKAHSPLGRDANMRGNSRRWIVRLLARPALLLG